MRVSPADQPGTHSYEFSKDGRWAFHTFSRFGQPPVIELVQLPDHKVIRALAGNAGLREKLAGLKPCASEFFRVDISNGPPLDAWCIKPPDFDPARRYPLLIHVYGEPAGSTVVDRWGGETYLWHCLLAQRGYVVISIDNRGTATPRGRDWRKSIYRQIGILASADQAAATRQILRERPYLDPARVGIWGWSGGGSMSLNAIFRYPDLYRTAMAIAFVSNQRFYDTIYQERYMGLPADNEAGFKNGSPITFAHQLKGNLLLVYGTGDDNCHYQNCEVLVNELIKHNKQFSLMSYPNRTHAIREGDNTKRHLFETLTRYLEENLPVTQLATAPLSFTMPSQTTPSPSPARMAAGIPEVHSSLYWRIRFSVCDQVVLIELPTADRPESGLDPARHRNGTCAPICASGSRRLSGGFHPGERSLGRSGNRQRPGRRGMPAPRRGDPGDGRSHPAADLRRLCPAGGYHGGM